MKRNEGKLLSAVIAAAVFALLAGCASIPFDEISVEFFDDFQADYLTEVKP